MPRGSMKCLAILLYSAVKAGRTFPTPPRPRSHHDNTHHPQRRTQERPGQAPRPAPPAVRYWHCDRSSPPTTHSIQIGITKIHRNPHCTVSESRIIYIKRCLRPKQAKIEYFLLSRQRSARLRISPESSRMLANAPESSEILARVDFLHVVYISLRLYTSLSVTLCRYIYISLGLYISL